ncbi:hypothetical protein [Brevibacterium luteolum]|uniref:hypothetical protein n=1 Tax=Brevibacterium luteolum TaxID=199591 RepID=UPI001C232BFA|nr:hypothetical protein [Brevibacterium luteolum]MBU8577619.1 hypothetical protein [Brevibacterium luteolum]
MITISRTTIGSAARSPVARRVARCLIGCAFAAVSVALDHKTEAQVKPACGDCA